MERCSLQPDPCSLARRMFVARDGAGSMQHPPQPLETCPGLGPPFPPSRKWITAPRLRNCDVPRNRCAFPDERLEKGRGPPPGTGGPMLISPVLLVPSCGY